MNTLLRNAMRMVDASETPEQVMPPVNGVYAPDQAEAPPESIPGTADDIFKQEMENAMPKVATPVSELEQQIEAAKQKRDWARTAAEKFKTHMMAAERLADSLDAMLAVAEASAPVSRKMPRRGKGGKFAANKSAGTSKTNPSVATGNAQNQSGAVEPIRSSETNQ